MHKAMAFISYSQAPELVKPGNGAFNHPAVGSQAAAVRGAAFGQKRLDALVLETGAECRAVVGAISI